MQIDLMLAHDVAAQTMLTCFFAARAQHTLRRCAFFTTPHLSRPAPPYEDRRNSRMYAGGWTSPPKASLPFHQPDRHHSLIRCCKICRKTQTALHLKVTSSFPTFQEIR